MLAPVRRTLVFIVVLLAGCSSGDVPATSAPHTSAPQISPSATETPLDDEDRGSDKADPEKADESSSPSWVVVPPGVMSRREAIERAFEVEGFLAFPKRIVTRFGYYTIPVADLDSPVGWDSADGQDTGHVAWRIDMFGAFEAFRHSCIDEWRIVINARTGSVFESGTGGKSLECPK